MKTSRKLLLTGTVGALIPLALYASDQVNGMYNFVDGDPILTDEVNKNFQHLAGLINSTDNVAHISVDEVTGNVGIGTTSPSAPLHVSSSVTATTSATFQNTSATGYGMIGLKGTGREYRIGTGSLSETSRDVADKFFIFDTKDQVMRMVVTPSGNVGIGTTRPEFRLQVGSSSDTPSSTPETISLGGTYSSVGGANPKLRIWHNSGGYMGLGASGNQLDYIVSSPSFDHVFYAASKEVLRIKNTGNVGIGTSKPATKLAIAGSDDPSPNFGVERDYAGGGLTFMSTGGFSVAQIGTVQPTGYYYDAGDMVFRTSDGSLDERMRIQGSSGNVGIGTTTPAYPLDVNGLVRATNVSITSDLRLKRDIRPLSQALEGIQCLQGVSYFLRDPSADQDLQLGFIAQEVERCYPEVVYTDPSGYKSVSYDRLVAPLVEAVKEQHSLNASQQLEIARLRADQSATRAELATTNARLAKLEALLSSRR